MQPTLSARVRWALVLVLALCALWALVYWGTGASPFAHNPYNSFSLQAASWLDGRLDVDYASHLEQAIYEGKYYISFPPLPSVILLPFVALMGTATPDHIIALLFALGGALFAYALARKAGHGDAQSAFYAFFATGASNFLFVSHLGWVWFIAQTMAFFFTIGALFFAMGKRTGLALFFIACAVGCRPLNLCAIPLVFFVCFGHDKHFFANALRHWKCFIAPGCVALFLFALNFARFGNPFEFGHNYLPEFLASENGQFHPSYILYNIWRSFRPADFSTSPPSIPQFDGWACYLVIPLFVAWFAAFCKGKRDFLDIAVALTLLCHLVALCAHKTMGGWHFGSRYLIDMTPVAYYGLLRKIKTVTPFSGVLCALGTVVNCVGTIFFFNGWL